MVARSDDDGQHEESIMEMLRRLVRETEADEQEAANYGVPLEQLARTKIEENHRCMVPRSNALEVNEWACQRLILTGRTTLDDRYVVDDDLVVLATNTPREKWAEWTAGVWDGVLRWDQLHRLRPGMTVDDWEQIAFFYRWLLKPTDDTDRIERMIREEWAPRDGWPSDHGCGPLAFTRDHTDEDVAGIIAYYQTYPDEIRMQATRRTLSVT